MFGMRRMKDFNMDGLNQKLWGALHKKYEAEKAAAMVNLDAYLSRSIAIAEHPDLIASMDELMEKYCTAAEKLERLEDDFRCIEETPDG